MSGAIYMAASGALSYEKRMEILANNLANVDTAGYKADKVQFRKFDLTPEQNEIDTYQNRSPRIQARSFWALVGSQTDFSEGQLRHTGNHLDFAIIGKGFFCVQTPDGIQYTRKGDFTLNSQKVLVTQDGWPVLGENGEIEIQIDKISGKRHEISVDDMGNIKVINIGGSNLQIDRLRIVDFPQAGVLKKAGDTMFVPMDPKITGEQVEDVSIRQGSLELSNVDAVKMMIEMIEVHRGYEAYQKVIRSIDEVNAKAINEVGRAA